MTDDAELTSTLAQLRPAAPKLRAVGLTLLLLALLWLAPLDALLALVCFALAAAVIGYALVRRHFLAVGVSLLASPFAYHAALAAERYSEGRAKILRPGEPRVLGHNLDRETRACSGRIGDRLDGTEWIVTAPNNWTVRALSATFGPMPDTYDGFYPYEDEACAFLHAGAPLPLEQLAERRLVVKGHQYTLHGDYAWYLAEAIQARSAAATVIHPRVLALNLSEQDAIPEDPCAALVILIDGPTGKPFAIYGSFTGSDPWHTTPSWCHE